MALRKPRNQPKPRPRRRRRPRGINWQAIIRAIRWGQRP